MNYKWKVGLGLGLGAGLVAWLWPKDSDAAQGPTSGSPQKANAPTQPLKGFGVEGTSQSATMSTAIVRTSHTLRADIGQAILQGFQAPNAYAATRHVWFLQERALQALEQVQADLLSKNLSIVLVDASRTKEQQEKRQQQRPDLAVSPQASNHTRGLAVDVRLYDPSESKVWKINDEDTWGDQEVLAAAMKHRGWRQHPREPWHFDFVG